LGEIKQKPEKGPQKAEQNFVNGEIFIDKCNVILLQKCPNLRFFMGQKVKTPSELSPRHDHGRCVTEALREAEKICRRRELRLTPTRKHVLEMVWAGHKPVKAYEIIDNFAGRNRPTKPPTVYRALDFLVEHGLVHRIESQNAFIGCPSPVENHTASFFICTRCQVAEELDSRNIDKTISSLAKEKGFIVEQKTVEVYGLCPACAKVEKK
jgi:Fur family zinc uptake transcriptional regulator